MKIRLKENPVVIKCYRFYNMTMNLFFRNNNLLQCYITGIVYKNIIDIAWDNKLYDCKFLLGRRGG